MTEKMMIPGPVPVQESVLRDMGSQVRAHYGTEWTAIYKKTVELLKLVFKTQGDVHILVGSGSSGLDAAIGSLTVSGEKIIVGTNGYFGERLRQISDGYGLEVIPVHGALGEPLNPTDFKEAISNHPDAAALALVHLETATTIVNPAAEIATEAKLKDIPVVLDAVSSLGGVPLSMDDWEIDICVSASQQCLGAPPGLAPVAISHRAWEIMNAKPQRNHGWYLNLQTWRHFADEWADWHPYPATMATNNVLALKTGLRSLLADGIDERIEHYTKLALQLREGVRRLGLQPFTPDNQLAPVVTAIYGPEDVPTGEIVQYLFEEHGIMISGGLGEGLRDRIFRVGHMGPMVSKDDIDAVLQGLSQFPQIQGLQ
ncbi:MAG: alanine--glyoxylate aminotransferase family protein [Anaerolineaceae bacterium]|nr:MAG: alanine--glyoxylate aminotransferase family protein [Anaerolineaceae bacterium]